MNMANEIKKKFVPHDIENDYWVSADRRGRLLATNKETHKNTSYPRLLVENHLGRYLDKSEHVHHIDGDYTNNNIDNLIAVNWIEHEKMHGKEYRIKYKKYYFYDVFRKCPICGITFQWTDEMQKRFYSNYNFRKKTRKYMSKEPMCSAKCSGIYGRRIQKILREERKAELQKELKEERLLENNN